MSEVRLIDANALKIKIASKYGFDEDEFDDGYNLGLDTAVDLIDSAPTVKPDMAQVLAYESGVASAKRPTGEWDVCNNCMVDILDFINKNLRRKAEVEK